MGTILLGWRQQFFSDTLFSIFKDVTGSNNVWVGIFIMSLFVLLPAVVMLFLFVKKKLNNSKYIVASFILLWAITCINIQFYTSDNGRLVVHRTALYLYPIIVLSFFSLLAVLIKRYHDRVLKLSVGFAVTLVLCLLLQINLQPIDEWWFEADNKKVLHDIVAGNRTAHRKIKLLPFMFCSNSLNYYIEKNYEKEFEEVSGTPLTSANLQEYDYLYIKIEDCEVVSGKDFIAINNYCNNRMVLYKRK